MVHAKECLHVTVVDFAGEGGVRMLPVPSPHQPGSQMPRTSTY